MIRLTTSITIVFGPTQINSFSLFVTKCVLIDNKYELIKHIQLFTQYTQKKHRFQVKGEA
jgi:hypothetical protein